MADDTLLGDWAFRGKDVNPLDDSGREAVRESLDVNALLGLQARLRTIAAGRGLWLLWTWLLILAGVTVTVEGPAALIVLALLLVILIVIINYVVRTRRNAVKATDWLSEVDFRLAQLAAHPPSAGP